MKSLKLAIATLSMTLLMSFSAFAGQWMSDSSGWWYQNTDGSYLKSGWYWIDGCCYYFNSSGYILTDTTAPDGSAVNSDGAWINNGSVVTRSSDVSLSGITAKIPNGYSATVSDDGTSIEIEQANPTSAGGVLIMAMYEETIESVRAYFGDQGLRQVTDGVVENLINSIDLTASTCLSSSSKQFPTGTWYYYLYRVASDGQSADVHIYVNYAGNNVRIVTIMGDNREFTPDQFINDYIK